MNLIVEIWFLNKFALVVSPVNNLHIRLTILRNSFFRLLPVLSQRYFLLHGYSKNKLDCVLIPPRNEENARYYCI